jgi:hypothetical protein
MRKFLTRLVYQLDKPFYVWALLAGPQWAQNITFFAIWIYIALFFFVLLSELASRADVLEKAKEDRAFAELMAKDKVSFLWTLPSFAAAIAAASQAWFVSATLYAVFLFLSYGASTSKKDEIRRILDENQGQK